MNCLRCLRLLEQSILKTSPIQLSIKRHYPEVRKRFYKSVNVAGNSNSYEVNLDHRKLKTPAGNIMQVPNYPLVLAVATEWNSVSDKIIPSWMHLTALSFTVIDNPQSLTKWDVAEKTLDYLPTDTLLFRDNDPTEDLLSLQKEKWDPILEWFNQRFNSDISCSSGIVAAEVSSNSKEILRRELLSHNFWAATGILYAVEAVKSLILALAAVKRRISVEEAVYLSRLETEFQVSRWGKVDWAHTIEENEILARFSSAILFTHLNTFENSTKKIR